MRIKTFLFLLVLLALSGLLVLACSTSGGGDDDSSGDDNGADDDAATTDDDDNDDASPADDDTTDDDDGVPLTQQIVFMTPIAGDAGLPHAPGPGAVYEIAVMNLDGSGFRQLTNDGKFKFLPHFSPDGTRILYTKYDTGGYGVPGAHADVAIFDAATSTETLVTHGNGNVQGVWSPDGAQIAYLNFGGSVGGSPGAIWIADSDGANARQIAAAAGTPLDMMWGDLAWSSGNWLLFSVGQTVDGCFKVRLDKMRPDGSARTQVTDGGPNCTPQGMEQSGDADPGFSPDGATIYSSRGFPTPPHGAPAPNTMRKLYSFSSDAWFPGKLETDLSLPTEPDCIEGVPKGSPDGARILLFRQCFYTPNESGGIFVTDTFGTYRTWIADGFGPDWNPTIH